jgi:hypothetical protein
VSHENLTAIPEQIVAGTQVDYRRTPSEFTPALAWTLKLYLSGGDPLGPSQLQKDFTISGQSFLITLTPTDTGALTRGNYLWEERAAKGAERQRFDFGAIEVLPDLETATAVSLLSRSARMLVAVRAALDIRTGNGGIATDMIEAYSIHGRSLTKVPLKELMDIESRLVMAVRREANPGRWGPTILARFPAVGSEQ